MAGADIAGVLKQGLLDGVTLLLASAPGAGPAAHAAAVERGCAGLGASIVSIAVSAGADAEADEEATTAAVEGACRSGPADALVLDGPALFAAAGRDGLMDCLQAAWDVARATANAAFLPAQHGGRIVLIAPAPDAGEHADAARAGLENLARTLSIEWSRYGVTAVAVVPGEQTAPEQVAGLVAYLCSAAGEYFSGCLLDLRGI